MSASHDAVGREVDVMKMMLPGGGYCRVIVAGDFDPRQIDALIGMLQLTADVLREDDAGHRAIAGTDHEGGRDGT